MGSKLYANTGLRACPGCGYRYDSRQHFMIHGRRQRAARTVPRVVIDGLVYDADKVPAHLQDTSGEASAPGFTTFPDAADAEVVQSPGVSPEQHEVTYTSEPPGVVVDARANVPITSTTLLVEPITVRAYDRDSVGVSVPASTVCECGYVVPAGSKSPVSALRMHRMKAKAHRADE